jgi:hypothetical protein
MPKRPDQDLPAQPAPDNELPGRGRDFTGEFVPHPDHPIFKWSWYALPAPLTGYLVIPSHVPFPGEPIDFEGKVPQPKVPTAQEVEAET